MRILLVCVLLSVALTGCVTTNYQAPRVNENVWKHWASIGLHSERLSDSEYRLTANGAGASREEDVIAAWEEFAAKVAGGRPYTKERETVDYTYRDPVAMGEFHAKRVTGKITLGR